MQKNHKLLAIVMTFFLFGAIFIFTGEMNRRGGVSSNGNLASVVAVAEDVNALKEKYQILSSNLGEYNAIRAFTPQTDPAYASAGTQISQTEAEMRTIEDTLFNKMTTSEYDDFIKASEEIESKGYTRTENTFINGRPQVDQVKSEPAKLVPANVNTTGSVTQSSNSITQTSNFGTKTYVPLSVLPGLTNSKNSTLTMKPLLQLLFKWGIAIAVLLSIVMITFGGFQYMTTDAVYDKSEGRAKINAAIVGLLLALSAWLILQTVDPRIVQDPQSKILN